MDDLQQLGMDALDYKNGDRLSKVAEAEEVDEQMQTGIYDGFSLDNPYGRRHIVVEEGEGYGYVEGEFISPTAPAIGSKVAVYYSDTGCLFDCL